MAADPGESEFVVSGFPESCNLCTKESRYAIFPTRSESSIHMGQVSGIGRKSPIGKSEFSRSREPGHHKSRNPENLSGPSVCEDRWKKVGRRRRFDHRSFDGEEIVQQEIAIRDFPIGSQEEENRRLATPVKFREIPRTVRSWRSCAGDNP
jgi:hypothetical protein